MALKNWTLNTVTASTETDLVAPSASKEVAVVGLSICNTEASDTAVVTVKLTTSANAAKATLWKGSLAAGEAVFIDTKIFVASSVTPDKIRVISDKANTSFCASGDES
jgi:hypothetical protein